MVRVRVRIKWLGKYGKKITLMINKLTTRISVHTFLASLTACSALEDSSSDILWKEKDKEDKWRMRGG